MDIKNISVKDLIPYEKNTKKHDGVQINNVAESIKQYGFVQPIVIDKNNVVVIGHCRLLAAKKLKMADVPCVCVEDLTEEQVKALRIVDNKSNEPITKLGDIWQLGRHRLMCGDSTDKTTVELLMNGNKADMVMTDPPYGINAEKMIMGTGKRDFYRGEDWDSERPDISMCFEIAPLVCIWGGNYFADKLPVTNDWLIWHKKNDGLSFSECELAWTNFGINCRHISHHWGKEKKQHITMKPLAVIAWAIERAKEKANVIVDLFGGSGSTLIACEQLDRTCYMMELDPKYCDVIIKRWETLTGEKAVLING